MTLLLFAVAAGLAAAGTRLAAVAFAGAAAAAAVSHTAAAPAGVWIACTCAGLILLGAPPRRLALPAAGAAAVLVAVSATNAAAVLPAWTVAAACAALAHGRRPAEAERRWTLGLLITEAPVAAAVCWLIVDAGFTAWAPGTPSARTTLVPALLLGAAALLRAPLAAGALDRAPEAGLVLVRAQAVVLLVVAATGPPAALRILAVAAAAQFAAGGLPAREAVRDAVQESALVALALTGTALGHLPAGWVWGALAAGTLLHLARLADLRRDPVARGLRALVRDGGLASPMLPVVAAVGFGAAGAGGPLGAWTLAMLVAGLAARAGGPAADRRRVPVHAYAAWAVTSAAVTGGLWAAVFTHPRSIASGPLPWPPAWAILLVAAGAVVGWRYARPLTPGRARRPEPAAASAFLDAASPLARPLDAARLRGAVLVPVAGLAALAVGVWTVGLVRGFL